MIPITRFRPSSITSSVHLSPCIRQRDVLMIKEGLDWLGRYQGTGKMIFGRVQRTATPANTKPFHEYEHEPETVAQRRQQERQN